jgi:hydrogenase nickel incorporation protein HypB
MKPIDVGRRILADNERSAAGVRAALRRAGTLAVNLISSPGSGKTSILEATVRRLARRRRLGVVIGDIATERDADRLRGLGIPAHQILTGGACHLDARQVGQALLRPELQGLDILFIENVGNLVCPTSYDLGEDFKVALLSVAEGDDKPFKYPAIFARAAVTLITKIDLLEHLDFDVVAARDQIRSLNPEARVVLASARTGAGLDAWVTLLEERLATRPEAPSGTAAHAAGSRTASP